MDEEKRELVKQAFNDGKHPVRVLIGTDAAREGINLQAECADLFHFDLPWNPGRMEQRNGRIDRLLQKEDEVRCHYFLYAQRPEDRVLEALVKKTDLIHEQLGSLSDVIDRRLSEGAPRRGSAAPTSSSSRSPSRGRITRATTGAGKRCRKSWSRRAIARS